MRAGSEPAVEMRGAFITLEGIEGLGKSTNVGFLTQRLRARGHQVVVTREPGGTALGEKVRDWVLSGEHDALSGQTEALLMFAARADHLERVIRPALAAGRWVVCDRFSDATLAYQGGGRRVDLAWLTALRRGVHGDLEPDLTLLFDADVEVGRERIADRSPDHFEREDRAFFERVRASYLALAAAEPQRIKRIDAAQPLAAVQQAVDGCLASLIERFSPRDE